MARIVSKSKAAAPVPSRAAMPAVLAASAPQAKTGSLWRPRTKLTDSSTAKSETALRDSLGFRISLPEHSARIREQKYVNPLNGREVWPKRDTVMEADHTFPVEKMVKLPGWDQLTKAQMQAIVHDRIGLDNIRGLPQGLNRSKQHKLASEWTHFQGQRLSPAYRQWLEAEQTRIERLLRRHIAREVASNLSRDAGAP